MKSFFALAVLCGAILVPAEAVTPVQKVIEMLQGMLEKSKKEKHEEQVQFAGYKQWCDDTTVEKQKLIKLADQQIDMLHADIQKYEAVTPVAKVITMLQGMLEKSKKEKHEEQVQFA